MNPEIEKRRTFAIVSHPDAGKTAITGEKIVGGTMKSKFGIRSAFAVLAVFLLYACDSSGTEPDFKERPGSSSSVEDEEISSSSSAVKSSSSSAVKSSSSLQLTQVHTEYKYDPEKVKHGTFEDPRDGEVYKTITVEGTTWLAENLRFEPDTGSYCHRNADTCAVLGRYYSWGAAQKACPEGWRLPRRRSSDDFLALLGKLSWTSPWGILETVCNTEVFAAGDNVGKDVYGLGILAAGYYDLEKDTVYFPESYYVDYWTSDTSKFGLPTARFYFVEDYYNGTGDLIIVTTANPVRCLREEK